MGQEDHKLEVGTVEHTQLIKKSSFNFPNCSPKRRWRVQSCAVEFGCCYIKFLQSLGDLSFFFHKNQWDSYTSLGNCVWILNTDVCVSSFPINTDVYFRRTISVDVSWAVTQDFFHKNIVLWNRAAAGIFYTYWKIL